MPKSKRRTMKLDYEEEDYVPSVSTNTSAHHIPLPRQPTFLGDTNWEAFIKVFLSLAVACGWSVTEEAADYLFRTQPEAVFESFLALRGAIARRFGEKTAPNTFISQLESRRLQTGESLAEYIPDLQRFMLHRFPSADEVTR